MDYIIIESELSINAINKLLNIKFAHEVFKKNKNKLDKEDLILTITEGICKIKDYQIKTEDNINFTFFLELNISSDGEQLIFLNGIVYDSIGKSLQLKDQIVNLNKENLYFTGDSILKTDQGEIEISKIEPNKYSINDQKIIEINKGIDINTNNLIMFKKGSIKYNIPDKDILLKNNQKIYYDNKYIEVQEIFFKYNNEIDLELVDHKDKYLYNLIIDNIDFYEINNLTIQSLNYENTLYIDNYNYGYNTIENLINNKIDEKIIEYNKKFDRIQKEINNINNSLIKIYTNKELLISLNKKLNSLFNKKNNINNESKQIISNNKKNDEIKTKYNKLIWEHWTKYGKNENKKMYKKIIYENADFEKYKNDYKFLCNKLGNNNKTIWNHWVKNGNKESKLMNELITFENCDLDEYKSKYPDVCKELNYNNKKIWDNWLNIDKYNFKIMNVKLKFENADIEKYKKDYPYLCKRICSKLY